MYSKIFCNIIIIHSKTFVHPHYKKSKNFMQPNYKQFKKTTKWTNLDADLKICTIYNILVWTDLDADLKICTKLSVCSLYYQVDKFGRSVENLYDL